MANALEEVLSMTMGTRIVIVAIAAMLGAFPAKAATTVFASSVFSSTGVTNASAALGATNGSAALISAGGELVLQYSNPLTGEGISASLLPLPGPFAFNVLAVSIGEVVGSVATFSGEFVLVDDGSGASLAANLGGLCSSVSASGCSLLKFRNVAAFGASTGALLDSASGVSNVPEPAAWALMMLGFAGVGFRLKQVRRHGTPARLGAGAALAA